MQPFPGGIHVVIESDGKNIHKIYTIGYKELSNKVIFFIASYGAGDRIPGKPYGDRWTDRHSNVN